MKDDQYILKKYLDSAAHREKNMRRQGGKYQFFCPVCGDDKEWGNRNPRGALILMNSSRSNEKSWMYKCMNGGCVCNSSAWSGSYWLKIQHPDLFSEYRKELFGLEVFDRKIQEVAKQETKREKIVKSFNFTSILKQGVLEKTAREFCKSRNIPERIWKDFLICHKGKYSNRVIIPFLNKNKEMYYFQARSLNGSEPKYLNPEGYPKYRGVYNIFNVDKKKPIILCEGPIDSMFLPNAIAVTGCSIPEEIKKALEGCEVLYLWDNDEAGRENSLRDLKAGKKVFLWNDFLKNNSYPQVKDINELLLKIGKEKFTFEELNKYFSNNIFDKLMI